MSSRQRNFLRAGLDAELDLFRHPRVLLAALALVLLPALSVLVYVGSIWDPAGKLPQLPVALINEDEPVHRAGRDLFLGRDIVELLEKQRPFGFVLQATAEEARAAVRTGRAHFALLIPADFSARATGADGPAQLKVLVAEGGNYTASVFGRRFAAELAQTINQRLGRERWAAVVGETVPAGETAGGGLAALRQGGTRLAEAAEKIHDGATQLHRGLGPASAGAQALDEGLAQSARSTVQLTAGMRQVAETLATARAKLPPAERLAEFAEGSATLARGAGELKTGLAQVQDGVTKLDAGLGQFQEAAGKLPFGGSKVAEGAGQLRTGAKELGSGLARAAGGATQLNDGLTRLDAQAQPLVAGLGELNTGFRHLAEKIPSPDQLTLADQAAERLREGSRTLAAGTRDLAAGAAELEGGTRDLRDGARELAASLGAAAEKLSGGIGQASSVQLAAPVEAAVEVFAPVPHHGAAFAPYFATLALWVGAMMMAFVFHLRRLPDSMLGAPRVTRWLTKLAPLLALGALQATAVVLALRVGLGIEPARPGLVWLVALLGSAAFISLVLLLTTVLGEAGRLIAIMLLIFQLAASGGIYPVELSAGIYGWAGGFLPFTFLLQALRAAMFGALEGQLTPAALALTYCALGATVLGMLLARWRFTPRGAYGAAVEI
ncbi:MAG: YhgE/Pip domain-containing protein [Opitutaceae bacterium]|nr:YhgE/Pip domain-containing protein [Opitutaceae bacterium]